MTPTERRVLAILLVAGNVNRYEFETLCNIDGLNTSARDRAVKSLRDSDYISDAALRIAGDRFTRDGVTFVALDGKGRVIVEGGHGAVQHVGSEMQMDDVQVIQW